MNNDIVLDLELVFTEDNWQIVQYHNLKIRYLQQNYKIKCKPNLPENHWLSGVEDFSPYSISITPGKLRYLKCRRRALHLDLVCVWHQITHHSIECSKETFHIIESKLGGLEDFLEIGNRTDSFMRYFGAFHYKCFGINALTPQKQLDSNL